MNLKKILSGFLAAAMAVTTMVTASAEPVTEDTTIATNISVTSGTYDENGGCEVGFDGYAWSGTWMCDDYGMIEMTFSASDWGNAKCIALVVNSGNDLNDADQGTGYILQTTWGTDTGKKTYRIDCSQYAGKGFNFIGYKVYRKDNNTDTDFNGDITIESVVLAAKDTVAYKNQDIANPPKGEIFPGTFDASKVNGKSAKVILSWTSEESNNGIQIQNQAGDTLAEVSGWGTVGSVTKEVLLSDFTLPGKLKLNAWGVASIESMTISNDITKGEVYDSTPSYILNIGDNIENGTVSANVNIATEGRLVTLTVTPDEGYEVDSITVYSWIEGDPALREVDVSTEPYTFAMPAQNATVVATFKAAAVKHTITVTKPTNGTVTATPTTAAKDETVTLTVTPATGYELDVLTVKEKTSGAAVTVTNKTFTMPDDDVTVTATFKAPLTAIDLDETATVLVGAEKTLTATKVPSYTTDTTAITWSSSDETVATVASDGTVTGVKAGTATITATCGTKSASCEVTVTAEAKPCTSVTLDKTTAEVTTGKTVTLKATTLPQDTTDNITWTTSNSAVATVTGGVVTGVAEGTATITVTCGTKTATCEVTVAADTTPCTGVALDKTTAEVLKGKTVTLTATATPADTTDEITWASSDTSIATVTNGVVTGVARGIATITATCGTKTATCEVSVNEEETISVPSSPFEPAKTFASAVTDGKYNENDVFVISAADVAAATSVTVTVTDSNGKKTTKDVTACYKKVTHTAADGTTDTITAGSNYLLAVTVTGIPEGTTVTVTVTVNK